MTLKQETKLFKQMIADFKLKAKLLDQQIKDYEYILKMRSSKNKPTSK